MKSLSWVKCSDKGPKVAFHAGAVVGDLLIVHGGIQTCASDNIHVQPQCQMYAFDLTTFVWKDLPAGPALSHHTCVATNDDRLIFAGGWNGRERCSDVHVFDIATQTWSHPRTTGFPTGAGLSSHSASLLKNGDILIIGREGSLRTQRRAGNAFRLSYNASKKEYVYSKELIGVKSRSGHTGIICNQILYLIGGRGDLLEMHDGYSSGVKRCSLITRICDGTKEDALMRKLPVSRKNHVAVAGANCFLINGGFAFDGKVRQEPVGESLLCKCDESLRVYRLPVAAGCERAGHVVGFDEERLFIHGGVAPKNTISGDVFTLEY